jgi:hypothetical protein
MLAGMKKSSRVRPGRRSGALLLDALMGLTVLTIGVLSYLFALQTSFRSTRDIGVEDQVGAALENAVETLKTAGFSTLYATYQGASLPATDVIAPSGAPATVRVDFDVNETALAAEYGPVADIDGDGAKATINASASYILLPTRLTLDYQMSYGAERKVIYLVLRDD